jgi:hypothetical protein
MRRGNIKPVGQEIVHGNGSRDLVVKHPVLYFALYYPSYPACFALSIYPSRCSFHRLVHGKKSAVYRTISGFLQNCSLMHVRFAMLTISQLHLIYSWLPYQPHGMTFTYH